jgi:PAS domain S-box-containing protein
LWETVLDGDIWHEEIENERADGTRYHADQTIAPIVEDSDVVKFVAIQQDITDRKRRELALEHLHQTTRELIVADTREEIATLATETAETVLGLPLNGVHVYDDETGGLELVAATDSAREVLDELPTIEAGEGLAWEAFAADEVRTSSDLRQERGVLNDETPVRSEMIFPLGDHGVMLVGSTDVDDFEERDVALAGILASNVEAAMDRVHHEIQLERYRQLIENVPVGVFRNEPGLAGSFEEVNPAMVEMFDAGDAADLVGRPVAELYRAPGKRELFSRKLDEEGIVVDEELRLETLDGEQFWGSVTAIKHETDGDVYYDGIVQDITERKRQEKELRLREQRFRRLFEGHNAPMLLIDPGTGAIERANEAAVEFYGYDREELTGMHIQDRNTLPDEEVARRRAAAEEEETNRFIFPHELADGSIRQVEVDSSPIRTGERRLLFSILHDVTERERNRERLEQQNEQLELLNRVVRHDIRNDMSVIIGHADMLNDHVDDDGQRFLDTLQEHSEHIVELTKTARELMEAMLGDGDSDPGSIDVGRLLQQEVDDVAAGYEPAEFTVEGSLPNVRVQGNEILSSAFRNLLTNAVQHNDDEVPQVTVTVEDRPDTVEVRVADNGPGVPDGQKEEIFGKGEHGIDSSGTGLGLYLVHTFVDQFGGDVWVTDNDPEGAVFHVELPKSSSR